MIYPVVRELAADGVPVATACRVLQVSASGFYDWLGREPSARDRADAELTESITAVHAHQHLPGNRGHFTSAGSGMGLPGSM